MAKANNISDSILPGVRIELRDSEWFVRRTEIDPLAGKIVHATGLSGVVRDKEAIFILNLENKVDVIDPANTELIADNSRLFLDTRLYLEAHFQNSLPNSDKPIIAEDAAIDVLPFQFRPAEMALEVPRARLLIADDVGLGKTLQAGILTSELIRRGRARRILVVTSKSMLTQFQKEFWTRFTIPLTRLDSLGIQRVKEKIPTNHNPFHYIDRSIISVDTLKNDQQYRTFIEQAWWDLIIIDEAQNVADRRRSKNLTAQRNQLARKLAKQSDSLVLLSATPHDGRKSSFASLMLMLDPKSIADVENYGPKDIEGLFIRRFRTSEDVKRDFDARIKERVISKEISLASVEENQAFEELVNLKLESDVKVANPAKLFKTTLEKALFSSPDACVETLQNRINRINTPNYTGSKADLEALQSFQNTVKFIEKNSFSKYLRLLKILEEIEWSGDTQKNPKWHERKKTDRIVIFSERIATIKWLAKNLKADLGLKDEEIEELHGSGKMPDWKIQQIVDDFGQENKPVRILIASDMAAEGINLHFQSHKLFHFDIPWSIMTFQQRNGRIDRYGQLNHPLIWYMMTQGENEKIKGDQRILEILIEKSQTAHENIGDPAIYFNTNDSEEQAEIVANAIAVNESSESFSKRLEDNAECSETNEYSELEEMLKKSFGGEKKPTEAKKDNVGEKETANWVPPSLFASNFEFAAEILKRIDEQHEYSDNDDTHVINLRIPDALRERGDYGVGNKPTVDTRWMPKEAVQFDEHIKLTNDIELIKEKIVAARANDESSWPDTQYLWRLHPIMDWFFDKAINLFGRNQAPVMQVEKILDKNEVIFLLNGVIPNLKGHPIIDEWVGVCFNDGEFMEVVSGIEILKKLELDKPKPNPNNTTLDNLEQLKSIAVDHAQNHIRWVRNAVQKRIDDELEEELKKMELHKESKISQLRALHTKNDGISNSQKEKLEEVQKNFEAEFERYWNWINETKQTKDNVDPPVRIVAVFRG